MYVYFTMERDSPESLLRLIDKFKTVEIFVISRFCIVSRIAWKREKDGGKGYQGVTQLPQKRHKNFPKP